MLGGVRERGEASAEREIDAIVERFGSFLTADVGGQTEQSPVSDFILSKSPALRYEF